MCSILWFQLFNGVNSFALNSDLIMEFCLTPVLEYRVVLNGFHFLLNFRITCEIQLKFKTQYVFVFALNGIKNK